MLTHSIRVVVANQPRLMREIVLETILEQPDIEVVAELENEDDIVHVIETKRPDFLIIALREIDQRPSLCDVLLRNYPEMKILALAPERNSSMYFWASFDIHESSVESSEAGILNTLRIKAQPTGVNRA